MSTDPGDRIKPSEWTRAQRTLFPAPGDHEVMPLYAITGESARWDRESITIAPGESLSAGTYFGTFPAAYWLAHTAVTLVRLSLHVRGAANLTIRATDRAGIAHTVSRSSVSGGVAIDVPLDESASGAVWFDVEAGEQITLSDIAWSVPGVVDRPAAATVCVTTFDREADCVQLLGALAADVDVRARVREIIVVDQGSRPLRAANGFDAVSASLGDQLRLIEQSNLGGSGGFSRGMIAAADDAETTHALLLDDDVVLEPESVLRMLAFADHADGPRIVGAHMLSLTERTVLHSLGERVDRAGFWWEPLLPKLSPVDLSATTVENRPELSARLDVDFNGWWMCLIPTATIRALGASLPLFIKWDDAEYGLRAAAAGVPTVTLPGAALWHMPWTAKDDGLDWQAYYQVRNRLVAALIHSPFPRGGTLLRSTLAQDVNHLLCLQYGSVAVRLVALSDVLSGPQHLVRTLRERPKTAREILARLGQLVTPVTASTEPAVLPVGTQPPNGFAATAARLLRVVGHQLRRESPNPGSVSLPRVEGKWWRLGLLDAAAVASATGTGEFVLRRDRRLAARLLRGVLVLRLRLWWRWPELARAYRAAAPDLASPETWDRVFDEITAPRFG